MTSKLLSCDGGAKNARLLECISSKFRQHQIKWINKYLVIYEPHSNHKPKICNRYIEKKRIQTMLNIVIKSENFKRNEQKITTKQAPNNEQNGNKTHVSRFILNVNELSINSKTWTKLNGQETKPMYMLHSRDLFQFQRHTQTENEWVGKVSYENGNRNLEQQCFYQAK